MALIDIELTQEEADKLVQIAAREGTTAQALARRAVRACLTSEAEIEAEILAGLAELDAGKTMTFEEFERDMEAFMADLEARRSGAKR